MKQRGKIKASVIGFLVVQIIIILFAVVLISNTIATQPKQSLIGLCLIMTGIPFYFYWKKNTNSVISAKKQKPTT